MYKPPDRYQLPSHSCDFDISGTRGIAGTFTQKMAKHSEEPIIKGAKSMDVSTGTCDSCSSSTSSPALADGHFDKVPVLLAVRLTCSTFF